MSQVGFANWIWLHKEKPKDDQKVIVRTIHNEMVIMQYNSNVFTLPIYSPHLSLGIYPENEILQWHPIPGFE